MHRTRSEIEVSAKKPKLLNLKIRGEDPISATPALYGNFLAVSRVGNDVQFEFVFLDLNYVAILMEQMKNAEKPELPPEIQGKTVAKIVMPAVNVLQLKDHFATMFKAIEESLEKQPEVKHGRTSSVR